MMVKIKEWLAVRLMIFLGKNGNQSEDSILLDVHSQLLFAVPVFTYLEGMMGKKDYQLFRCILPRTTNGQYFPTNCIFLCQMLQLWLRVDIYTYWEEDGAKDSIKRYFNSMWILMK